MDTPMEAPPGTSQARKELPLYTPPMDVTETNETLFLEFDLPGVRNEDLQITVEKDALTVRGRRHLESPTGLRLALHELGSFDYRRSIRLPADIDREAISANLASGVLRLALPRRAEARARRIPVDARAAVA